MLQIIKQTIGKVAAVCALFLLFLAPYYGTVPVAAAAQSSVDIACQGLKLTDSSSDCDPAKAQNKFGSIVKNIINILSVIVGAVSVVVIIIGGFRYVVSNGDSNGVTGAKNAILYAIIGLVIVLFAQVIVRFVLSKVK